jgi:hypothetical protein
MESGETNVVFVIAIVFAVAAVLTVIGALVAAWWVNNPKITVRRGSKSQEFNAESPTTGS